MSVCAIGCSSFQGKLDTPLKNNFLPLNNYNVFFFKQNPQKIQAPKKIFFLELQLKKKKIKPTISALSTLTYEEFLKLAPLQEKKVG